MSQSLKIIIIVVSCFAVFLIGMLVLLWFLRDRIMPKPQEKKDREPGNDLPDKPDLSEAPSEFARKKVDTYDLKEEEEEEALSSGDEEASEEEEGEAVETSDDLSDEFEEESEVEGADGEASEDAEEEVHSLRMSDLLRSGAFLGKTLRELRVPEKYLSDDGSEILTEGGLFGTFAYGGILLVSESLKEPYTDTYYIISYELSYDDCKAALNERFGAPLTEGTQEGEHVSEGSTTYAAFKTEQGTLWLSKGSNNDYINLNLVK